MNTDFNTLYAALRDVLDNAFLLASEIDTRYGTSYANSIPELDETPPSTGDNSVVYGPNGATAPDSDGLVTIKSVEDFRSQYEHSTSAQVRNLCASLPSKWFVQDTLDTINDPTNATFFQVQANTNTARLMLSLRGAARTSYYVPVYKATRSSTGLFTQGELINDAGAFSGDFIVGGSVRWTGVRIKDVPSVLDALLQRALKNPTINNQ